MTGNNLGYSYLSVVQGADHSFGNLICSGEGDESSDASDDEEEKKEEGTRLRQLSALQKATLSFIDLQVWCIGV